MKKCPIFVIRAFFQIALCSKIYIWAIFSPCKDGALFVPKGWQPWDHMGSSAASIGGLGGIPLPTPSHPPPLRKKAILWCKTEKKLAAFGGPWYIFIIFPSIPPLFPVRQVKFPPWGSKNHPHSPGQKLSDPPPNCWSYAHLWPQAKKDIACHIIFVFWSHVCSNRIRCGCVPAHLSSLHFPTLGLLASA